MNREVHVRFWEGLAVRFRWATQLSQSPLSCTIKTDFLSACFSQSACVVFEQLYTSYAGGAMRTNIVIDNSLMRQAMKATGLSTKKAVVEEGLRLLIKVKGQEGIRRLRGKVEWEGDLSAMREGRIKAAS
jgi:Arc/MetJ family transcription regulator